MDRPKIFVPQLGWLIEAVYFRVSHSKRPLLSQYTGKEFLVLTKLKKSLFSVPTRLKLFTL